VNQLVDKTFAGKKLTDDKGADFYFTVGDKIEAIEESAGPEKSVTIRYRSRNY
jgi:hypothetical protein